MKDILILGVPRSGKTTLSIMLAKELKNYQIISLDNVRNSFDDVFPELDINPRGGKNNFSKLPRFVSRMIYYNRKYLKNQFNYIIEGAQILPSIAKELFSDSIVIFLGHGSMRPKQILDNIRKYDTPDEYSYQRKDKIMLESITKHINMDKDIQEKCRLYGFKYIDTSTNRVEKLNKLLNELKKSIIY